MKKVPKHVAIIMDGNGRWATKRSQPRFAGHLAGAKNVPKIIDAAIKFDIKILSLFAFSSENWKRPPTEVDYLMGLFLDAVKNQVNQLQERNVKLRVIGDLSQLSEKLRHHIIAAQKLTEKNTGLILVFAINYSGRWDILEATKRIARDAAQNKCQLDQLDNALFSKYLSTVDLPDPDLLIRTSGEHRISNFFLWQFAYTELYFPKLYWPEFDEAAFKAALNAYANRERRFGSLLE